MIGPSIPDLRASRLTPSEVDVQALGGVRLRFRSLTERDLDACRAEAHKHVVRVLGQPSKEAPDVLTRGPLLERAIVRSILARAVSVVPEEGAAPVPFVAKVDELGDWTPDVIDLLFRLYGEHLERVAGVLRPDPETAALTVEALLAVDDGQELLAGYDGDALAVLVRALVARMHVLLASDDPGAELAATREAIATRKAPIAAPQRPPAAAPVEPTGESTPDETDATEATP